MAQRDTKYATEIASVADDLDQRIERLYVKGGSKMKSASLGGGMER
jgi:hypothetical protein